MSEALVQVGTQALQQGGLGINSASKLLQLKAATLSINQKMTQAKDAIPGKLRITETGQQFDEMIVALLDTPVEERAYYEGEERNLDTRLCFSTDLERPHAKASVPQAITCANCPKASWEKWRQNKIPANIPPCETFYRALLIDTVYQIPLQLYIRSTQKKPFEAGMQNLARTLAIMKAQSKTQPNIYDVKFRISTREETNKKKQPYYVLQMSDFKVITPDEREQFGAVYSDFTNSRRRAADKQAEQEAAESMDNSAETIEASVVEGEYVAPQGEITI